MGFTWEETEVAALDRHGWRRSVSQCVQLDAGLNRGQGQGHVFIYWLSLGLSCSSHCWDIQVSTLSFLHQGWSALQVSSVALRSSLNVVCHVFDNLPWLRFLPSLFVCHWNTFSHSHLCVCVVLVINRWIVARSEELSTILDIYNIGALQDSDGWHDQSQYYFSEGCFYAVTGCRLNYREISFICPENLGDRP